MITRLLRRLLLVGLLAAPLHAAAADPTTVPLPRLPAGAIELRVAHVVNPRFPQLEASQVALLLAETTRTVRAHFGVELVFTPVETGTVAALFARFGPALSRHLDEQRYDVRSRSGDRGRLVAAMIEALEVSARRASVDDLLGFAGPYLTAPPRSRDLPGLADALVETHLSRLAALAETRALDGGPVIDRTPYNEWVYWDTIGYAPLSWDVIVTNQPVASAEYLEMALHASLRGGVTVGSTNYSRDARLGAAAWLSTFPFTSALPEFVRLRDGERYGADDAARIAGAYLAHEIGHLLFHFGHPFGNPSCVMAPAPLLHFRAWLAGLDPARCPIDSTPAMRPGAATLDIDPARQRLVAQ